MDFYFTTSGNTFPCFQINWLFHSFSNYQAAKNLSTQRNLKSDVFYECSLDYISQSKNRVRQIVSCR